MTKLLQQALTRLQELPAAELDAIATLILEELADEKRGMTHLPAARIS